MRGGRIPPEPTKIGIRRNSSAPDLSLPGQVSIRCGSAHLGRVHVQQRARVRTDRDAALLREQLLRVEQLLVQVHGGVGRGELAHEDAGQLAERVDREALVVEHHLGRPQVRLVDVADRQGAHRVDGGRLHVLHALGVEQQVALAAAGAAHHPEGGAQERPELVEDELGAVPVRLVERAGRVGRDGGDAACGELGHRRFSSKTIAMIHIVNCDT